MSVLKVHYFLWFGALSGIMPFVSVFVTRHNIATIEEVGVLYFVLPFIVSVIKPLFCSIADRNNSHKKILIVSIVVTIVGYGLLLTTIYVKMGRFTWYWLCFLMFLANSGQGVVICLNDYLVMKEVTELNKSFGSYRVFGTLGWGGIGLIAGVSNENIKQLPYLLPGLLLFITIELIDLFCMTFKLNQTYSNSVNNSVVVENLIQRRNPLSVIIKKPFISALKSLKQIYRIFGKNPSLLQYIVIVLVSGALTSFHWTYYFYYLEKIRGEDQLLAGLALFVQSFLGELPIFLVADRIIRFCGPSMSLNISLGAFALRYFIYGFVFDKGDSYWDILLIEIVQGLTFGLFYTAMANLAQHYANRYKNQSMVAIKTSKNEDQIDIQFGVNSDPQHNSYATLQGLFSGAFEGVGLGVGALIGGYVSQRISEFYVWKIGTYLALATILFNISIETIKYFYTKKFLKLRVTQIVD